MGGKKSDQTWRLEPDAFVAGLRHATPVGRCGFHAHEAWEIVYHARGVGRSSLRDGRSFEYRPGSLELVPPGLEHDQESLSPGEDVCVLVRWQRQPARPAADWLCLPRLTDACLLRELETLGAAVPGADPVARAACDHRAAALFLGLVRLASGPEVPAGRPEEHHARRAAEFLRENSCRIGSVAEAAEAVGLGYDHLRHVFRRTYGVSLKAWLLDERTRRARELLAHSAWPLKTVAGMCGFGNQRYFSTCFRRMTGTTPGAFRRAAAGRRP